MKEVSSDYLWDKSGAPDPEVRELEALLSAFRHQPRPLRTVHGTASAVRRWRMAASGWRIAASVVVAAIALSAFVLLIRSRFEWRPGEPWQVAPVAGSPRIAGAALTERTKLAVGQVLETDAGSRARLRIASIGVLDVEPNSRLQLLATRTRHHRVALDFGTVRARIWAPPFSFGVQTPSSLALDLGCAFTLHVGPDGYGRMQVTSGWVQLQRDAVKTIIPAGAEAITRPGLGPGTAYFADAPKEFKKALADIDTNGNDPVVRGNALPIIIATARPRDAMTLLALLRKLPVEDRPRVLDRLTMFVAIPAGFGREDVLELHMNALDAYWSALGLGHVKSWILNWRDAV
jgi:hypothetical protein